MPLKACNQRKMVVNFSFFHLKDDEGSVPLSDKEAAMNEVNQRELSDLVDHMLITDWSLPARGCL